MSNEVETNATDPIGDRSILKVVIDYVESRNKVSKLAVQALLITSLYTFFSVIMPPQYVLWAWNVLVMSIFLVSLGLFAWHETIGVAGAMKPVYKLLHRLTGDDYYKNLIGGDK